MFEQSIAFTLGESLKIEITVSSDVALDQESLSEACQRSLDGGNGAARGKTGSAYLEFLVQDTSARVLKALGAVGAVRVRAGTEAWTIARVMTRQEITSHELPVTFVPTEEGLVELQQALDEPIPQAALDHQAENEPDPELDPAYWLAEAEEPPDPQPGDLMAITKGQYKNAVLTLEQYDAATGECSCTSLANFGEMGEGVTVEVPLSLLRQVDEETAVDMIDEFGMLDSNAVPLYVETNGISVDDLSGENGSQLEGPDLLQRQQDIMMGLNRQEEQLSHQLEVHLLLHAGLNGGKIPRGDA